MFKNWSMWELILVLVGAWVVLIGAGLACSLIKIKKMMREGKTAELEKMIEKGFKDKFGVDVKKGEEMIQIITEEQRIKQRLLVEAYKKDNEAGHSSGNYMDNIKDIRGKTGCTLGEAIDVLFDRRHGL